MQRKALRLVLLAAFLLAFAAACGGSSRTKNAVATKPTTQATLPFRATFSAPTHSPVVNKNWPITVTVSDLSGKPIAATLQMNVLLGSLRVGQIDNGKIYRFVGRYHEIITWPLGAVGHQLKLQSVVRVNGKKKMLLWAISVAKK